MNNETPAIFSGSKIELVEWCWYFIQTKRDILSLEKLDEVFYIAFKVENQIIGKGLNMISLQKLEFGRQVTINIYRGGVDSVLSTWLSSMPHRTNFKWAYASIYSVVNPPFSDSIDPEPVLRGWQSHKSMHPQ